LLRVLTRSDRGKKKKIRHWQKEEKDVMLLLKNSMKVLLIIRGQRLVPLKKG